MKKIIKKAQIYLIIMILLNNNKIVNINNQKMKKNYSNFSNSKLSNQIFSNLTKLMSGKRIHRL